FIKTVARKNLDAFQSCSVENLSCVLCKDGKGAGVQANAGRLKCGAEFTRKIHDMSNAAERIVCVDEKDAIGVGFEKSAKGIALALKCLNVAVSHGSGDGNAENLSRKSVRRRMNARNVKRARFFQSRVGAVYPAQSKVDNRPSPRGCNNARGF